MALTSLIVKENGTRRISSSINAGNPPWIVVPFVVSLAVSTLTSPQFTPSGSSMYATISAFFGSFIFFIVLDCMTKMSGEISHHADLKNYL